jgi:hypothetical protein
MLAVVGTQDVSNPAFRLIPYVVADEESIGEAIDMAAELISAGADSEARVDVAAVILLEVEAPGVITL